jgi:hypothetical protein
MVAATCLKMAAFAERAEIRSAHSIALANGELMHGNSYALIATATDYDAWRPHTASVTAHDVLATSRASLASGKTLIL